MFQLDFADHRPLYEQIKDKLKFLIIKGALQENEQIPPVRELATTLTINPNTIQKAYKDLESEGYIYSIKGKGSFVAILHKKTHHFRIDELKVSLSKIVKELKYIGLSEKEIYDFVKNIFKESEDKSRND